MKIHVQIYEYNIIMNIILEYIYISVATGPSFHCICIVQFKK